MMVTVIQRMLFSIIHFFSSGTRVFVSGTPALMMRFTGNDVDPTDVRADDDSGEHDERGDERLTVTPFGDHHDDARRRT